MENPIDIASKWLGNRGAAYLAKENVIVYYATTTGRKSDYQWITLALVEVVRIIRATLMNPVDSDKLQSKHLVAACQELDRVFEFGVKSRHSTRPEIFNYLTESGMDMGDSIVSVLADILYNNGYKAMLLHDIYDIINEVQVELKVNLSAPDRKELVFKHFPTLGYVVRTGSSRPEYQGKKQQAVMLPATKPRDILMMSGESIKYLKDLIVGALK